MTFAFFDPKNVNFRKKWPKNWFYSDFWEFGQNPFFLASKALWNAVRRATLSRKSKFVTAKSAVIFTYKIMFWDFSNPKNVNFGKKWVNNCFYSKFSELWENRDFLASGPPSNAFSGHRRPAKWNFKSLVFSVNGLKSIWNLFHRLAMCRAAHENGVETYVYLF